MASDRKLGRRDVLVAGSTASAIALLGNGIVPGPVLADNKDRMPRVPRRVLGKTGKDIPILLLGGAAGFDTPFDPKIAEALRFGVNYIDAARTYNGGRCEAAVGTVLKRSKVSRDRVWITSKSEAHDVAGFRKNLAQTLSELQSDYVDMYYLHNLEEDRFLSSRLRDTVDAARKEGKLRFFGFSCHGPRVPQLLQLAARTPWVDSVMFRYNFRKYDDKALNAAIDAAHKAGVGLIAMKTQGSEASFADAWKKFEKKGAWTKHQAVLKAVWADERIAAAVSHMDSLEKLRQNVAAAVDRRELSQRQQGALRRYAEATRSLSCDGCDHICGAHAPAGIRIGDTLRFLMYHDVYGEKDKARRLYAALPRAARDYAGVDFGRAAAACPHGVEVGGQMKRALEVLG